MWSVPNLYKEQLRLLQRIREEDVVRGSSVVDVLTLRAL
jgi:putative hemolysin